MNFKEYINEGNLFASKAKTTYEDLGNYIHNSGLSPKINIQHFKEIIIPKSLNKRWVELFINSIADGLLRGKWVNYSTIIQNDVRMFGGTKPDYIELMTELGFKDVSTSSRSPKWEYDKNYNGEASKADGSIADTANAAAIKDVKPKIVGTEEKVSLSFSMDDNYNISLNGVDIGRMSSMGYGSVSKDSLISIIKVLIGDNTDEFIKRVKTYSSRMYSILFDGVHSGNWSKPDRPSWQAEAVKSNLAEMFQLMNKEFGTNIDTDIKDGGVSYTHFKNVKVVKVKPLENPNKPLILKSIDEANEILNTLKSLTEKADKLNRSLLNSNIDLPNQSSMFAFLSYYKTDYGCGEAFDIVEKFLEELKKVK